jgi:hypothetical protein
MQVAHAPDSLEQGGDMPTRRAVWRVVTPDHYSVTSARPSRRTATRDPPPSSAGYWIGSSPTSDVRCMSRPDEGS